MTAVGDCDRELQGVIVGCGPFSFSKHGYECWRQEIKATHRLDPNAATVNYWIVGKGSNLGLDRRQDGGNLALLPFQIVD